MGLRVCLICPAPPGSRQGNRITAVRWARILRSLGHAVTIGSTCRDAADMLVALHARKSAPAVRDFRARHPERRVVVALTGTDLYRDLGRSRAVWRSLVTADRLVVLQPLALRALPRAVRPKARVIHQSSAGGGRRPRLQKSRTWFDVCVLSHLRAIKDPFRAAIAVRRLPTDSRVRVLHAGGALTAPAARRARVEESRNPRYRWLGERSHAAALALLARSRLLVLGSRAEGGANVIGEAAVRGVPVVASRIDGNLGLLGAAYPGFFAPGDTAALTALLRRAETDPAFSRRLKAGVRRIAPLFHPLQERRGWRALLTELAHLPAPS